MSKLLALLMLSMSLTSCVSLLSVFAVRSETAEAAHALTPEAEHKLLQRFKTVYQTPQVVVHEF